MTNTSAINFFQEMSWAEVRPYFLKIEPNLVKIIDELSPARKYKFLKISYPYGNCIFTNKILHVPTGFGCDSVPTYHPSVKSWVKKLVGYTCLPTGVIVAGKGAEFFMDSNHMVHPISFCEGGCHLGIWEFFEPPTPFTVTAGARSSILIPKIQDKKAHIALGKHGVKFVPSDSPFEQWNWFKSLVNTPNFFDPWVCEVIFFNEHWLRQIKKDPAWIKLKYFILERAWQHTAHGRYKFLYNDMWESFADHLSQDKIKPASYMLDVFKYLIHLATGSCSVMAYKPTDGSDVAGPINTILKVLLDVYGLKNYAPTLMVPTHFDYTVSKSMVYCPLQIPVWWSSTPKSRDSISTKRDLDHLIWLFDNFMDALKQGKLRVSDEKIKIILAQVSFDFFHSDGVKGERIQSASLMPLSDRNLLYVPGDKNQYGTRKFADRSTFARGCVRVSARKK